MLALPVCARSGLSVGLLDATFTAFSAVCVTGLTVLDTPQAFSVLGQLAILLLIQAGGLGIMTFSTAAMRLLGRRMSLRHEGVVAGLMSVEDRSQLFAVTRRLLRFTLLSEAAGAVLLTWRFWTHDEGLGAALWRGVFTAVSAFCNAGFALQSDNLIAYQRDPAVLHVVAALVVLGGLSPAVCFSGLRLARGRAVAAAAQVKVVLTTTLVLLVGGTIALAVVEWHGAFGGLPPWDRLHNAWLHSVSTRTAGFNAVDLMAFRPASVTVMMVLMFIGGSPGGTAGGIKTTTAALLLMAVVAAIRGHGAVEVGGRRVPHRSIYRAAAVATLGLLAVFGGLLMLQLTQTLDPVAALFEVISALGTVGLTIGGTAGLDAVGKLAIVACMFVGRVGPLTLFMFLSHHRTPVLWRRPVEEIDVG
ncbi:MAG: TrkH family potassium uptake protein [Proteobacteria bacterium]|nr:TrkH family potassium uptake protein [Pseudomonadota bacterium]